MEVGTLGQEAEEEGAPSEGEEEEEDEHPKKKTSRCQQRHWNYGNCRMPESTAHLGRSRSSGWRFGNVTVGLTRRFGCYRKKKNRRADSASIHLLGFPKTLPLVVGDGVDALEPDGVLRLVHAELTAAFFRAVW